MKVTIPDKLDKSLLGERVIRDYNFTASTGESNDGRRRGYNYTVRRKIYGTLENETKNEDGTYTYDYSSKVIDDPHFEEEVDRQPEKSEFDLEQMVEELLFQYNIHEFSTDLQEETNSIKNYYVYMEKEIYYEKDTETKVYNKTSIIKRKDKEYDTIDEYSYQYDKKIKSESIDDMNDKLNSEFSKEDYILYLQGKKIKKNYEIKLGLDEIKQDETVRELLSKISIEEPKNITLEEALNENIISIENIENLILKYEDFNPINIPSNILEQLFEKNTELISHLYQENIPIDILRKYSSDIDITAVKPSDLLLSDLDNVLQNVIQDESISARSDGTSSDEVKQEYLEYLQKFYDNPEALRKIIPVINTALTSFFQNKAKGFIEQISPEVLEQNEIRDILVNTPNISLKQILKYQLNYDENSVKKLKEILSNTTSRNNLEEITKALTILQQNGINNDEILQSLRENGFNFYIMNSKAEIQKFKSLGLEISLDDLRDNILKTGNFNFLNLSDNITPEEITREYNSILNEMSEDSRKDEPEKYDQIFDLMINYSNSYELFSRLTPEVKNLTKKLMIENMDRIKSLQGAGAGYDFSYMMQIMELSFGFSEDELTKIYMKCLNNGASKETALKKIKDFLPEESQKGFKEKINKANIYPSPKYRIPLNKLKYIRMKKREERNTVKSKIQADGRCFSTKLTTDMVGKSKDGKKIIVNNLSKWLFGVPGARGNLAVSDEFIMLPPNTPEETVELIEDIVQEKQKTR